MGLKRELEIWQLTFASIAGMIGSGWLFSAFYASSMSGPLAIISWIIGALIITTIALVYAKLSLRIPTAGAAAVFPKYTQGKLTTALNGWSLFMGYVSTPPLETIAALTYLNFIMGGFINFSGLLTQKGVIAAILLLIGFFIVNSIGISKVSKFNFGITFIKIIIPMTASISFLITYFSWSNFTNFHIQGPYLKTILSTIPLSGIAFSFLGFRQAVELAGEAKNPEKTLPRAIILSVIISTIIYITVQLAFIASFQWGNMVQGDWQSISSSQYVKGPMLVLASVLGLTWLATILLIDGVISPLGTGNIYQTSTARVVYALGDMGFLPSLFKKLNRFGVPFYALLFDLIIMLIFILPFPSWQSLVSINSGMSIIAYATGPLSLEIMYRKGLFEGQKMGIIRILSPIAFSFSILLIYWSGYPYTLYMSIIAIFGLLPFIFSVKKNGIEQGDLIGGAWFVAMLITVPILSYLGSEGNNIIPFPYDNIIVFISGLLIYGLGIYLSSPIKLGELQIKGEEFEENIN